MGSNLVVLHGSNGIRAPYSWGPEQRKSIRSIITKANLKFVTSRWRQDEAEAVDHVGHLVLRLTNTNSLNKD